ncbi:DUF1648 domain-containing protein [Rhodococcus sp. UNC363MFTsu5.1]|uniref:DUF1648 domain-containing protein n=1 Tax=Rhodococcus sp. UNC363MFTsu5.1 TaxID=1449069 RepID=UPI000486B7B1|nr:DUF1648 domain-containing protein [Rhodococcus sp. UNC363MFTsu5.1]
MSNSRTFDPAGVLFGIGVPVLAAAVGLTVTRLWSPRLPDTVATHWAGSGPDGFSTPGSLAATMVIVILLVGCGASAIAALAGALLMMRRAMLIVGLTVVGLLLTLWIALLATQLDLASAVEEALPMTWIGLGIVAGAAVGILGASMLRDHRERSAATLPPDPRLPRGPLDLPITVRLGLGPATTAVLLGTGTAITGLLCARAGSWWPLAVFLPVSLLMVGLLRFRVTLDETGLWVHNMGMTAVGYGVEELVGANVEEVNPSRDFGGWGLRLKGRGNYGVVTTTGPAVVFTAANGQRLTVTTPRAEEMAGALNTLADRRLADR